ncbi:hypothetical protein [Eubacterium sp.]|uniref:hypothetical protein n=1 Tax=Eubacterium sp. TaxID=142586 RepID=UPI003521E8E0
MRKNILMIATVTMMAFAITACGSDSKDNETTKAETTAQVTTEEATTVEETTAEETTVEKTTEAPTKKVVKKKKVKKNTETQAPKSLSPEEAKATAKSYVGKTIDQLVAAIGQYNSMDKSKSCLVDGEYDGMFYYDGFTVSASTENGVWVISSVD